MAHAGAGEALLACLRTLAAATGLTTHDEQPERRPAHSRHAIGARRSPLAIQRVGVRACAIRSSCGSGRRRRRRSPTGSSTSRCRPSRRARTCRASSPGSTPRRSARRRRRCAASRRDARRCSAPTRPHRGRFPFFLSKRAPVSGVESLLEYQGRLIGETRAGATHSGSRSRCRSSRCARARRRSPTTARTTSART